MLLYSPEHCTLCPRECGADRTKGIGACGAGNDVRISKTMLHFFEEPPISGTRGSGAVFFCGCSLMCGYCQNAPISHGENRGEKVSLHELAEKILELQNAGTHNINLVTAAHFLPHVVKLLRLVKPLLSVPVVYNSSGYENAEALSLLNGLVDVYLPDFKYISGDAAKKYSKAENYPEVARAAIAEMVRQTGEYREENGIAVRGTIIRHLVLPGLSNDGVKIMKKIAELFPAARVSVMSQYTPSFNKTGEPALDRKVTSFEYNRVVNAAKRLGLEGFMQFRSSASSEFTPDF